MKKILLALLLFANMAAGQQGTQHVYNGGRLVVNGLEVLNVKFYGSWKVNEAGCGCSYSNVKGDSILIWFVATNVYVWGESMPTHGMADIYLDGRQYPTLNQYNETPIKHYVQWQATNLPAGNHKLKLIVTGQKDSLASNRYLVFRGVDVDDARIDAISNITYLNAQGDTLKLPDIRIPGDTVFLPADTLAKLPPYQPPPDTLAELPPYQPPPDTLPGEQVYVNDTSLVAVKKATVVCPECNIICKDAVVDYGKAWMMFYVLLGVMVTGFVVVIIAKRI